jgi:hypothetical protein
MVELGWPLGQEHQSTREGSRVHPTALFRYTRGLKFSHDSVEATINLHSCPCELSQR